MKKEREKDRKVDKMSPLTEATFLTSKPKWQVVCVLFTKKEKESLQGKVT